MTETENRRLKILREALGLTQEKFGARIYLTPGAVSDIERGKSAVTDRVRDSVCRAFGASSAWLQTGEGEMLEATASDLQRLFLDRGLSMEDYLAIKSFMELPPEDRAAVLRYMRRYAAALAASETGAAVSP